MSANLFDAGDMQRLDRERNLVKTTSSQLPEDRPVEEPVEKPFDSIFDGMLNGLMAALKRRLE